jgi:ABC-type lipoprotein export system ATPase subunit
MRSHQGAADFAGSPVPPAAVPDLVICERVAHTYGSGVTAVVAVHDVTCRVLPSTRVAITGPSGSGKSTLLHLMAGLETATAGALSWPGLVACDEVVRRQRTLSGGLAAFAGRPLGGHPLAHPGRIGIVFQGPSLLPALDALENVAFPLQLAGAGDHEAKKLAWDALNRLAITELAGSLPQELSGGQAQRVAVARVIAAGPALILADEPTGQLDHHAGGLVIDVLLQAADELGAGLVVSTHDPLIAHRLPEQWTMNDGRLLDPTCSPTGITAARPTGPS